MKALEILETLGSANGISGFEEDIKETAKGLLAPICDEVYESRMGSVIGVIKSGKENAKRLMIEAHLDRIGLMVKGIDENGFVKFTAVGGVDPRILMGSEVYILGKDMVYGITGALPPHLKSKEDKDKMPKISEMLIDTGMSANELKEKISIGDGIIFKSEAKRLLNNEYCAVAMDNRGGMAAVLLGVNEIKNSPYDIYIVFCTEEELGLHGAYTAAAEISPDLSVVVDVTHGMTPDTKEETGVFKTGSGAIICRGPNFDYALAKSLVNLAKENNIKYDIEVASGNSGTNAWAIQTAGEGIKTLLLSIPLKYMHTFVETLDLSDIEETGKLIKLIGEGGLLDA